MATNPSHTRQGRGEAHARASEVAVTPPHPLTMVTRIINRDCSLTPLKRLFGPSPPLPPPPPRPRSSLSRPRRGVVTGRARTRAGRPSRPLAPTPRTPRWPRWAAMAGHGATSSRRMWTGCTRRRARPPRWSCTARRTSSRAPSAARAKAGPNSRRAPPSPQIFFNSVSVADARRRLGRLRI